MHAKLLYGPTAVRQNMLLCFRHKAILYEIPSCHILKEVYLKIKSFFSLVLFVNFFCLRYLTTEPHQNIQPLSLLRNHVTNLHQSNS